MTSVSAIYRRVQRARDIARAFPEWVAEYDRQLIEAQEMRDRGGARVCDCHPRTARSPRTPRVYEPEEMDPTIP